MRGDGGEMDTQLVSSQQIQLVTRSTDSLSLKSPEGGSLGGPHTFWSFSMQEEVASSWCVHRRDP